MENKKIYIEIGSNIGTDTDKFVSNDSILYCFEPAMELAFNLWQRYKNNDNVIVLPFAIDVESCIKKFNIAGSDDWGCSSLNVFSSDIHSKWPNRPDFKFTDSYVVPTITLYDFITLYKIDHIDYLWIDAQGHDFNVIKSLKNKISIVKEGSCEAAYNISLYDGADNNYKNITAYLELNNFTTKIEVDKSDISAECDILFKQKI